MLSFFMKLKHLTHPLSISLILTVSAACETQNNASSETAQSKEAIAAKTIRAVTFLDNGAVVPLPNTREVTFLVEDSSKISLTYAQFRAHKDSSSKKIILSDPTRREEIYDNILELAELPDGVDIKPGKQACVGSRSIDISVIFNNGDTSRFSIMGGARCDKSLCPSFWAIDSLANVLITN
jgi:hypothetical protein